MDQIKVLVADDNDSDRLILSTILRRQGHLVVQAANGREAVDQFEAEKPHMVLLDALMPEMDGFEAARLIKCLAGEDLIPIIFLTSLRDAPSLAKCLDAGGDDFLSKPYNRVILEAKINAFQRMRQMHETLQNQRDQIAENNTYMLQEQRVAKAVFDNVAHSGCLDSPIIKHLLSPLAVFNGDVLLAAYKPSGGMHILLGDFTGHGLPAAIGAMPLAEIFYGMTVKGFGMTDILREINMKLKSILPVGVFCCVGMIDINFWKRTISVWLGGLPSCYLLRQSGEKIVLSSNHLPVGVVDHRTFDDNCYQYSMEPGDRFYLWSDGIHEARNDLDEMYGEERLEALFDRAEDHNLLFDEIKDDVSEHIKNSARDDDITMIEVLMVDDSEIREQQMVVQMGAVSGPTDWSMSYKVGPSTLRDFNPLPLLLHQLLEVPGLRPHSGTLYTLLAEMFSNALEHGVMRLSSALKVDPAGFEKYYQQRQDGLDNLTEGFVEFGFEHTPTAEGGALLIRVVDSGTGFDFDGDGIVKAANGNLHGRGLPVVASLCRYVRHQGCGNQIEALFEWQREI